jgi:hypothetical protein
MAALGDVGLATIRRRVTLHGLNHLTRWIQAIGGNGPITNTGLTAATANGLIVLSDRGTARVDATRANGSGIWSFYDISIGRYTASDVTNNGQWFVDVEADGSFTVTENPGAPVTTAFAYA